MSDATERAAAPGNAAAATPDLVTEATRRSGLIWIGTPGQDGAEPVWHHWFDGAAYVITGGAERSLPGLCDSERATVTVRSRATGERLVTWLAAVDRVRPGSAEWDRVMPGLSAKRLNSVDGRLAPARWARESVLIRLTPTGQLVDVPPTDSGAAPPAPTPATTSGPLPFLLGRRRRRPANT
jgi:hypothetical protein